MYKQPQKIITHYATQKYDLKRSQSGIPQGQTIIIRYSTQKYDLKRSQSGIPHGQMTSKDHNPVFHMDKRPQKITIWYSAQINNLTKVITHYPTQKYNLKRSQSGIPHRQMTSKDHNPVFHKDK